MVAGTTRKVLEWESTVVVPQWNLVPTATHPNTVHIIGNIQMREFNTFGASAGGEGRRDTTWQLDLHCPVELIFQLLGRQCGVGLRGHLAEKHCGDGHDEGSGVRLECGDLRLRREKIDMSYIRSDGVVKGNAVDSIVHSLTALAVNIVSIVYVREDGDGGGGVQ